MDRIHARNTADYDAPIGLTADPVVFTLVDSRLSVLLARRLEEPQRGMFALPGGFVGHDESPEQTAERKLREKTGVGSVHLEQLRTYAEPERDPRGWLPSIAYMALVAPEALPDERPAGREASWHPRRRAFPSSPSTTPGSSTTASGASTPASPTSPGSSASAVASSRTASRWPRPSGSTRRSAARPSTPPTSAATSAPRAFSPTPASNTPKAQAAQAASTRAFVASAV